MSTIHKYPLVLKGQPIQSIVSVEMPNQSHLLDVQMQEGSICLWAMVTTELVKVKRRFAIIGTGHDVGELMAKIIRHVGTVQDGGFVWHVFEIMS